MNLDQNKIDIFLENILLQSEFQSLIHELEKITEKEFQTNPDLQKVINSEISYITREKILKTMSIENNLIKNIQNLIQELSNYIKSNPYIEFTFAILPSHDLIQEISNWLENTLGRKTLFNIKYDRNIYAGVIISFNGQYRNFTLKDYIKL